MRKLLILLIICGCGFTGEKPFAGRPQPDVAPWEEVSALTFCQAQTRIGTPASKPGGLCTDGSPGKPCTTDGDCRSRERCACGQCTVLLCDSADECRTGQTCSFADRRCDTPCAVDADCASGEVCLPGAGVCRGTCAGDGDCQTGERCDTTTGKCVSDACSANGNCFNQPTCAIQRIPGTIREPSPISDGHSVILYVERVEGLVASVWRATSGDGRTFTFDPETPVITPDADDNARAGAPAVWRQGGAAIAIYANGNGRLRSATGDGVHFVVDAAPALIPTTPWEMSGLDAPSLAADGSRLYYGTVDRTAIGVADKADSRWVARAAPVLTPSQLADANRWRGVDAIASPFAEIGTGHLFFTARGRESMPSLQFGMPVEEPPNFSIGEASTLDGTTLVPWPYGPVFDRTQNFLSHPSELDPAVVQVGERRLLYYRGAAADETRPTGLAAAQNPVPIR